MISDAAAEEAGGYGTDLRSADFIEGDERKGLDQPGVR